MNHANISFELERIKVSIDRILPVRIIKDPEKKVRRYREIVSTIREVGLIEPLMVYPETGETGNYLLTDGHLRLAACRELGIQVVECIVALDDESYTYNAKVTVTRSQHFRPSVHVHSPRRTLTLQRLPRLQVVQPFGGWPRTFPTQAGHESYDTSGIYAAAA